MGCGPVLDAGPHRPGGAPPVRRDLHPGGAGPAVAPDRLERAGPRPPGGRTGRGGHCRLEGGDLARGKRPAADLGAWLVFEDESGQGLRPPKGRTGGRRGRTPVVKVTGSSNRRVSLAALIAARGWLTVYQLPAYAPELNPVEPLWSHLKRSLANLAKRNLAQLTALIKTRLKRMQYRPGLLNGFLASTGLDLTPFCNSHN